VDDDWLANKFMVVRVEDFFGAVNFFTETSSGFLGLQKQDVLGQVSGFIAENEGEIRDRTENYYDWRSDIDFEIVEGVQSMKFDSKSSYFFVSVYRSNKSSLFLLF